MGKYTCIIIIEIFQFGLKWWTDLFISTAMLLAWLGDIREVMMVG